MLDRIVFAPMGFTTGGFRPEENAKHFSAIEVNTTNYNVSLSPVRVRAWLANIPSPLSVRESAPRAALDRRPPAAPAHALPARSTGPCTSSSLGSWRADGTRSHRRLAQMRLPRRRISRRASAAAACPSRCRPGLAMTTPSCSRSSRRAFVPRSTPGGRASSWCSSRTAAARQCLRSPSNRRPLLRY